MSGEAVCILTYYNGQAAGTGYAHPACDGGAIKHEMFGKPDYGGYNEDMAKPAYSDGRTVVPEALPTAFDGDQKL